MRIRHATLLLAMTIPLTVTMMVSTGCTNFTYSAPDPSPQDPATTDTMIDAGTAQPQDAGETTDEPRVADDTWILETSEALTLIDDEHSVVWDAREGAAKTALSQAQAVTWQEFSREDAPYKGLLLDDFNLLGARIMARGVTDSRRVIVLDDPLRGWGEGGRLVWMLRTLGHSEAHLVMVPEPLARTIEDAVMARKPSPPGAGEVFSPVPDKTITATAAEIRDALGAPDVVFIDVREQREYEGETPYGEARGGHLPGAVHLYFKALLNEQGGLIEREALMTKLAAQGITPDRRIVAYCTGGIRSAWLVVVLKDLGFERVENYAGSMWEWAAQDAESHPLEK